MPEYLTDGSSDFLAGQDASKVPDKIPQNAYAAGVNVSVKNGILGPRPGWGRKSLIFTDKTLKLKNLYEIPYENIFRSGNYQAVIPYGIGIDKYQIYVIAGIIFLYNQNTNVVDVIEIEDGSKLDESQVRINWSFAGRFIVIFDFPARPVIIEGTTARRSNEADNEVPVSVLGAYNQNRLFIVNAGNEFTAGDPTGSLATPDAPITFDEVLVPSSPFFNQIFQLPTDYINENINEITAATFLQFTDTSTGIGPLLLSTSQGIYTFQTQLPRDQWEAGQFGTAFVYNNGIAGPKSFAHVNSDLFYISSDGQLRTLSMSRDEQKKWSKKGISREVQNWIKFYDKSLIQYGVIGYFANKILVAVNPYRTRAKTQEGFDTTDVTHAGFVVIELDNISTLTSEAPPVWAGLWTGVRPMDFCFNDNRCFVISKDLGFRNEIYELMPDITYDTADAKIRDIRSRVYFREYSFESEFQNKSLHSLEVNLAALQGNFSLEAKFKPAHASKFKLWRKIDINVAAESCDMPTNPNGFLPFDIGSVNLGGAEEGEVCDEPTQKTYGRFRKVQLLFDIVGRYWQLHELLLRAIFQPQNENAEIFCEKMNVAIPADCNDDWVYEEV